MKRVWKFASGVTLTVWLTLAAILLLLAGSFYVKSHPRGFNPLNHSLLQDWLREWGLPNLDKTWWFMALIGVLFLLGINTTCCVLDRLGFHWNRRRQTGTKLFLVRIAPTFIHATFSHSCWPAILPLWASATGARRWISSADRARPLITVFRKRGNECGPAGVRVLFRTFRGRYPAVSDRSAILSQRRF